jgi:hypothetical protein
VYVEKQKSAEGYTDRYTSARCRCIRPLVLPSARNRIPQWFFFRSAFSEIISLRALRTDSNFHFFFFFLFGYRAAHSACKSLCARTDTPATQYHITNHEKIYNILIQLFFFFYLQRTVVFSCRQCTTRTCCTAVSNFADKCTADSRTDKHKFRVTCMVRRSNHAHVYITNADESRYDTATGEFKNGKRAVKNIKLVFLWPWKTSLR